MSKESYIGGMYIETTGGDCKNYAGGDFANYAEQQFIQSADNGIFYGTNDEPPIISTNIILKKFLVHFRRNSSYNGEFGFDWMRDEYIYPITSVNGTNKELSLDIPKLKTEYKTTDVANPVSPYGRDYYCSFLNLMLNQEATLDIAVEELEALSSDATEIVFESSNADLVITPTSIPLSALIAGGKQSKNLGGTTTKDYYLAANQVKVKCDKAFTKNEQIKVFAKLKDTATGIEDKKEVGKMMVMKNDQVYRLKARFVEVVLKGKIKHTNPVANTKNILNFSKNKTIVEHDSLPSGKREESLNTEVKISDWKKYIENKEPDFIKQFQQASIKYDPIKISGKIDYRKIEIDFKDHTIGDNVMGDLNGVNRIKNTITGIDFDALVCNLEEFLLGLKEVYELKNTYEKGITVFLMPIITRFPVMSSISKVEYHDAFADDIFSTGRYILMAYKSPNFRESTLIHEAAHTLGLFHSFQTLTKDKGRDVIPIHTFEYGTTDNIMDYSIHPNVFWKWQWLKMQEDKNDLTN